MSCSVFVMDARRGKPLEAFSFRSYMVSHAVL
jgi:hypothetical protein